MKKSNTRGDRNNQWMKSTPVLTYTQKRLTQAIHATLFGMAALTSITASATPGHAVNTAESQAAFKRYDIPAGTLETSLNELARTAGVTLSFDPALTEGKNTSGLSGKHSLADAFAGLLAGSGLETVAVTDDRYTLKPVSIPATYGTPKSGETMLPEVLVVADSTNKETASGPISGYVAKHSITGTKTDTPIVEIPQSISVVTRDELDARGVQGMTEALRYVPGVVVDNWGYEARGYEYLLMRGFDGLYYSNYRDSLHQLAAGLYFSSFLTEPYGVERIEVMRGPSSVLFGQGDAGGIVNRVSKLPSPNAVREIGVRFGNFNRKQVNADIGGAVNESGTLLYRIVGLGLDTDTQVKYPNGDRASIERKYLAPSLTWNPTSDTSVTVFADILKNNTGASPFYRITPNGIFTRTLTADPNFVNYKQDQKSISYKAEHRFNDTWTVRQNFRNARTDVDVNEMYSAGYLDDQRTMLRYAISTKEQIKQTVVDTQLQAKLHTGKVSHTVLFGVDSNVSDLTLKAFDSAETPPIDVFAPVYGLPIPTPDSMWANGTQGIQQLGFYVQDQIKFSQNWILTLGGRKDQIRINQNDPIMGITDSPKYNEFSGRAGLTYMMANGLAPYISYADSFLPQTALTFDGRLLDPSRARQYEIGIKYQPKNSRNFYSMAVFDLVKTNVATPDLDPEHLVINPFASVQTGEIRSRGVELEARTQLTHSLSAIGAFTYNDVEVTRSNDVDLGKTPPRVPKTTASLWLDYQPSGEIWRGLGVSGGARFTDGRFNDSENQSSLPSFTLFDAGVRYHTGPWHYAVNVSNLFNKQYTSTFSPGFSYYRGVDRNVIASVSYRW